MQEREMDVVQDVQMILMKREWNLKQNNKVDDIDLRYQKHLLPQVQATYFL